MGQTRVGDDGIKTRQLKIERWERQIQVWEATSESSPGLDIIRTATGEAIENIRKDIYDRVKNLSFSTEADRADLAKLAGRLDGLESIYYDIAEASRKIEGAKEIIGKLKEEIERARKGQLLGTRA